ncbi:MAG: Asp-tRNA(Asn)/Glu-tRNA(Gln) amidotransferase subunit GatB [Deltaproteobacteria bacterium]|nr:Asp-tRNA(Asn)/Glu-tRNA(Gln) amidotransferase subunit GatB [Deltaproteobacteria bacterium]
MARTYEPVIGLEVHAQLLTRSKMFCGCSTEFGAPPNTHVCPVCLGLPGALPVPNGGAVEMAIRAALALGCTVRNRSRFARKNYFYPDLAKNYQISQYELPLNEHGRLEIEVDGVKRRVGIVRIHLEEDAAKNLHPVGAGGDTLVDFNRGGTPLMEIVSDPDMRSAAEAEEYLRKLREILMFAGVNDGNLEEGSFRCDANVSLRPTGQKQLGTRVELKNINSFRFVRKAIEYEVMRQQSVLDSGGIVEQETRAWNVEQSRSFTMRSKEEAMDYRYFPDPDLPELVVSDEMIARARAQLAELPAEKRARYRSALGLTEYDASVLTSHPAISSYFESCTNELLKACEKPLSPQQAGKRCANFIQSEVMRYLKTEGLGLQVPVTASRLAELIAIVEIGAISGKMAKEVFAQMAATGKAAKKVVEQKGLSQISDASVIDGEVERLIQAHPEQVEQYRSGNKKVLGFFVGQVMKATKGSANPKMVNEALRKYLEG